MLYLGTMTAGSLANLLAAGLGYVPVTYADAFDGGTTVSELQKLGVPQGVTVLLDVEGPGIMADPAGLITKINAWGDTVQAVGYIAGVYIGSPQPLTSAELSALRVFRYMRGQGSIRDRNGALAEPSQGWCAIQAWPSQTWAGVWADVDFAWEDYHSRTLVMCVA
jgi:hypothetical protein